MLCSNPSYNLYAYLNMFKEVNTSTFLYMQLKSYVTLCWYKSEIIMYKNISTAITERKHN